MIESITELPKLLPRAPDSHKGTFGKVLVVAGSRGMSGAAILCGSAALRGGAGLVQVALPADIQPVVAAGNSCYTTACLPIEVQGHNLAEDAGHLILQLAESANVLAIGPGIGQSSRVPEIIEFLLVHAELPIVLDADGINALSKLPDDALKRRPAPTVLTPHPGEFARLIQKSTQYVQANRQDLAVAYAEKHEIVLVLKGNGTLVTDGKRMFVNTTGNPGMATGGTGDVLTGLIAALIAQGLPPFDAAQLGVHLHGKAGDLAANEKGPISLIASDLIDYLPRAFQSHI
jgi:ADP-dependent NAD(P)H-hydrate dehydratase